MTVSRHIFRVIYLLLNSKKASSFFLFEAFYYAVAVLKDCNSAINSGCGWQSCLSLAIR